MSTDPQARLGQEMDALRQRLETAEELRRALVTEQLDGFVVGAGAREPHVVLLETSVDDEREALRAIHDGEVDGVVVGGEEVVLVGHAQESYRALVDRMPQGAVTVSMDGSVVYANERFAAMVGRARESLLGQALGTMLGTDLVDAMLRGARPLEAAEVTIARADGTPLRVGLSAERVESAQAVTFMLSDLTERDRHAEIQERAERNDRFLAVLAHELRNPLGAVRNAVQILHRAGELAEEHRFAVDVIARQSETLVRLVDDLLDVHRLNEDKIVLRRQPVDLREVIWNAVEAARPGFAAKEQQLQVTMPETVVVVDADVVRLAQVLGNVLANASKFTPAGGSVHVSVERRAAPPGGGLAPERARIRVVDDGIGVPPQLLEKIFEPYTQAAHHAQVFPEGLGLGLSVARRLVELHGGTIEAHSQGVAQGLTVVIDLPTCSAPVASADVVSLPLPRGPRLRILIADDDEDSAASLSQLLALLGHETSIARNGVEALTMADEVKPHVVILDIGMPRLDGWAAGRILRARPWADRLVVYALTGWSQQQARERTTAAGFDRHFAKPLDFDELARDLHERFAHA